ncbi:MAG: glycosyltransferase [Prevotella sp.]|jgi:GT2 family glycosyltransferase|nr:glycosyltransferase [Prevotella sp.]
MQKLAPIVLFVYNRPMHTMQTLEALSENLLADDSELIIFSDAPKNISVADDVEKVRSYIKTVHGFKSVTIIERDTNWGLAASIIDGVTEIVDRYGKVIVLEDDIVTSPYFLKFMNGALDFYESGDIRSIDRMCIGKRCRAHDKRMKFANSLQYKELANRTGFEWLPVIPCPTMNYRFLCVCRDAAHIFLRFYRRPLV